MEPGVKVRYKKPVGTLTPGNRASYNKDPTVKRVNPSNVVNGLVVSAQLYIG